MNKRSVIESILYAIVAFMLIALLYAFSTMMMARSEAYGEVMVCMGGDRSVAAYEACFEEVKRSRSHATLHK